MSTLYQIRCNEQFHKHVAKTLVPDEVLEEVIIPWIAANLNPEDVFPESDLIRWAQETDWKKDA
jgi:hypothetical protein